MTNYGTVQGYKDFAALRGVSFDGKSDAEIAQALVRATAYLDGAYRSRFPGYKTGRRAQALEWPRTDAVDASGEYIPADLIPGEIEAAAYEGTTRELAKPGSLAPDIAAGGRQVKRKKIASIEVEYAIDGSLAGTFRAIELTLGSLLDIGSDLVGQAVRA
jgi:hypothetical protein